MTNTHHKQHTHASPLKNILVLDFSTLLPGPLTSLLLAQAGARVIKIEHPDHGDELRHYEPRFGNDSVNFALLNAGKESLSLDLKNTQEREKLTPFIEQADIVIEQFRPGVMKRLGLSYEDMKEINPQIIYCSITGYGQTGPLALQAGHDLNYMAASGCLSLSGDQKNRPTLPPVLIADIAGGAYPAYMNILTALYEKQQTQSGRYLDIAMCSNLFTFCYWALGEGFAHGTWPQTNNGLVTGASARYQIYETQDGEFLAVAALEEKFWNAFCDALNLETELRDDSENPKKTIYALRKHIAQLTAQELKAKLEGKDICCNFITSLEQAVQHPHFTKNNIFTPSLNADEQSIPALPTPLNACFAPSSTWPNEHPSPKLGQHNAFLPVDRNKVK